MDSDTDKVIAVFDFDGTITIRDTLFDFIRFYVGVPRMVFGLLLLSPMLMVYKLGLIKNGKAKQLLFSHFFKEKKLTEFDSVCERYKDRINKILRPEAIGKIKYHQQLNHTLVIDSASIDKWIIPWAKSMSIDIVIGTQIEIKKNRITGQFEGKNCYGAEKVSRLLQLFPDREKYTLYAYGDSSGDKALLDIADFPFYRKF